MQLVRIIKTNLLTFRPIGISYFIAFLIKDMQSDNFKVQSTKVEQNIDITSPLF